MNPGEVDKNQQDICAQYGVAWFPAPAHLKVGVAQREVVDRAGQRTSSPAGDGHQRLGKYMKGHDSVKHSNNEYVRGGAHTNTVEGFFSLLKRGINGIYHHVGKGHVGRYVDEFSFRYDHRKISDGDRANLAVLGAEGKRLTYKQPAGMGACLPARASA